MILNSGLSIKICFVGSNASFNCSIHLRKSDHELTFIFYFLVLFPSKLFLCMKLMVFGYYLLLCLENRKTGIDVESDGPGCLLLIVLLSLF